MMSSTPGRKFVSATWHSCARCRNSKPSWDHWARLLSIFVTSPITSQLVSFIAMTSRDCRAPIMSWNIALGWHASMSDELQVDVGLFLGSWSVGPFASLLPSSPKSRPSRPRSFDPAIISAGAPCVRTCSSVRKPGGDSFASAKILPPISRLWKLNCSREDCHSAFFLRFWRCLTVYILHPRRPPAAYSGRFGLCFLFTFVSPVSMVFNGLTVFSTVNLRGLHWLVCCHRRIWSRNPLSKLVVVSLLPPDCTGRTLGKPRTFQLVLCQKGMTRWS